MMCDLLRECGSVYGFDGEEAIVRLLGISGVVSEKRGRPKKAGKDVSCEKVVDLFAACVSEGVATEVVTVVEKDNAVDAVDAEVVTVVVEKECAVDAEVVTVVEKDECDELADLMGGLKVSEKKVKKDKKITDEEKALSEAKKEAEKIKKAEEKALSEAKKEAEKIKKAEEKAQKEAEKIKKAEEKAQKEAEKVKKAEEKALKEAEKVKKTEEKAKKEPKKEKKNEEKKEETKCEEKVEERPKITVTRFEFEGKQYLKSSENILYDASSREEMGIWCEETKSIKELPQDEDEDEEMDEESYEE
jgi:cell division protein FtsN